MPLPRRVIVPGSGTTAFVMRASELGVMNTIWPLALSSTAYNGVHAGTPLAFTVTLPPADSAVLRSTSPKELALPKPRALRLLFMALMAPPSGKLDRLTKEFPLRLAPLSEPAEAAMMMTSLAALPFVVNTLNVLPVRTKPTARPLAVPPPKRATLEFPAQVKVAKSLQVSASAEALKIRTRGIARASDFRARKRIAVFLH